MRKSSIPRLFIVVLLCFFALCLMFGSSFSSPKEQEEGTLHELFSDVYITYEQEKQDPTIVQMRYVQVNFEFLEKAESILLNLFNTVSVMATRERIERRSESRYTWFGRISGKEYSSVVLTIENGSMAGNITFDGKVYQVRPMGNGIHAVREIDQSAFPTEAPPIPIENQKIPIKTVPESQFDDGSIIDVMVVYTDDVANASGNIGAEIQLAIDETNASYANSGINQRVRLVHTAEVNYAETGNISAALDCITSKTDGCLDQVHSWRDTYGADEVSFWVENGGNYCGIAYMMYTVSPSFEENAFSVVARSCATGYYSFGHEMGHNMGAHHDTYVAPGPGAYEYSHGYVYLPGQWRTVMAYNNQCAAYGIYCTRLPYWSNPDITYGGVPMGVENIADNTRCLNNTAYTVANFRQSSCNVSFTDVPPGYWAEEAIKKMYCAGITKGCSQNPLMYCPEDTVTRAQMAIFLGRGIHGSTFTPPPATGMFADVPMTYWAANWIEQFYDDGITSGCSTSPLMYCPENPVTRAQMAIFLLRSKHGSGYTPPPATGIFADVPLGSWAGDWIEQLYNEGITTGCATSPLRYCPGDSVTRAQMAVFIVRTFGL